MRFTRSWFQNKQTTQGQQEIGDLKNENTQLKQENERLIETFNQKSAFATLEHYVRNISRVVLEYPGNVAVAVFSCVNKLPFNPMNANNGWHSCISLI